MDKKHGTRKAQQQQQYRGDFWASRGAGNRGQGLRGRGRGREGGYITSNETDFILQVWDNNQTQPTYSSHHRGRGRGGGIGSMPERNNTTSTSRGYDYPTRPGRGGGRGSRYSKLLDPNALLSITLRPLLRPVIFVPATQSQFLFKIEDELIQPIVEDAGVEEQSHVPTAEKVARLFSGSFQPPPADSDLNENPEDLEETVFADVVKFQEAVDYITSTSDSNSVFDAPQDLMPIELDAEAMKRFTEGMSPSGSRHVTMDDLDAKRRMRKENEDKDGSSDGTGEEDEESDEDDEDVEEILDLERISITEAGGEIDEDEDEDEEDEESSDGDGQIPKLSFQARLDRLRKAAQDSGKGKGKVIDKGKRKAVFTDEDSDEGNWDLNRTWAEEDDDFDLLDENDDIVNGWDRMAKTKLFKAVYNGNFEDEDRWKPARKAKDKYKDLSPELAELWKKDRAKKALYKQERVLARLAAAADPLVKKKGGKKAMLAAAKADPTITVLPNRVIVMTTFVQQIHRFIADIGGPNTMALPPANKHTRKGIHELAAAFGLKSQSRGRGDVRYTTLIKTAMTGVKKVNQKKISRIIRRGGDGGEFVKKSEGRFGGQQQREGEEVGKAAPRIGETNIGFKMLAAMGWSEGDSIGFNGGTQNPLTAVIKLSKKGLGATN